MAKYFSFSKSWTINGKTYSWNWSSPKKPAPEPEPDPTPEPTPGGSNNAYELQVIDLLNSFRVQNGKPKLSFDQDLADAAEKHSLDMAANDFFSHTGSNGSSVGSRVSSEGYDWRSLGENIAAGQDTPADVMKSWENSPGHRSNMLGNFTEVGIGFVEDTDGVGYGEYWTMVLATPDLA